MPNHSHRAGKLKQQNKKNKRSSASKRSVSRNQGGKIQLPSGDSGRKGIKSTPDTSRQSARANRANAAKQRREVKRKNVWNARRTNVGVVGDGGDTNSIGGVTSILSRALANTPPRIVGIISLSELEGPLEERVRHALTFGGGADKILSSSTTTGAAGISSAITTAAYSMHAKGGQPHISILTNTSAFRPQYTSKYGEEDASVQGALDLCRVCDLVLFLIDGSTAIVPMSSSSTAGGSMMMNDSDAHSIAATSVKTSNTTAHLDHLVSERGDRILGMIKAQGLPTPVTVIVHKEQQAEGGGGSNHPLGIHHVGGGTAGEEEQLDLLDSDDDDDDAMEEVTHTTFRSMKSIRRSNLRKRSELKRYVGRLATTEFGVEAGSKVVEIDIATTATAAVDEKQVDDKIVMMKMGDESTVGAPASVATGKTTTTTTTAKTTSQTSIAALVRMLCTMSASGPNWVANAPRPYLITDGTATSASAGKEAHPPVQYNEATHELKLTGYIRGNTPWNTNQLVHVPHMGTFAVKDVKLAGVSTTDDGKDLLPPIVAVGRKIRKKKNVSNVDMTEAITMNAEGDNEGLLLAEPDPEERESLVMFASPDALEGEQNLIGFDDDDDGGDDHFDANDDVVGGADKDGSKNFQAGTSRPAGWSDYQSAWLDAIDDEDEDAAADRGELAFALNKKSKPENDNDDLMDDDAEVNAEEKRALLAARKKNHDDDRQFPDEVDHEEETSARDRYARYRALKSFRKSYWDPKENLPESYGAVYHFSSFKATQRDVMGDVRGLDEIVKRRGWGVPGVDEAKKASGGGMDVEIMEEDSEDEEEEAMARASVPPGAYVTITLEGVPSTAYTNLAPNSIITAVSLMPHENKVSVLHMALSSSTKSEHDEAVPIKSKDALTFRCGWRTWQSRPIFSQHNLNSDKHKFERYMPSGGGCFFAASVFGPVTYAPCPVMMFREASDTELTDDGGVVGKREFLAHGSMLGADADRIVLKRIIMTGYPTRVHKRHATVKYMFYNPEDVKVSLFVFILLTKIFHMHNYLIRLTVHNLSNQHNAVVYASRYYHQTWITGKHHPKCW